MTVVGEPDFHEHVFLHNDMRSLTQPDYGVLTIADVTFDARIRPIGYHAVRKLEAALATISEVSTWFRETESHQFEKPSSPVFQPPEYESTNCCMGCPFGDWCGFCLTHYGTSGEFNCICQLYLQNSIGNNGTGVESNCSPKDSLVVAKARAKLVTELRSLPRLEPNEEGRTVDCPNPEKISWSGNSSNDKKNCVNIPLSSKTIYAGHSHAFYDAGDMGLFVCCNTKNDRKKVCGYIVSNPMITALNNGNKKCSRTDKLSVKDTGVPLQMIANARAVKDC